MKEALEAILGVDVNRKIANAGYWEPKNYPQTIPPEQSFLNPKGHYPELEGDYAEPITVNDASKAPDFERGSSETPQGEAGKSLWNPAVKPPKDATAPGSFFEDNQVSPMSMPLTLGAAALFGTLALIGGRSVVKGAGKSVQNLWGRTFKRMRRLPNWEGYMAKAALPAGVPGGFRDVAERHAELLKLRKAATDPSIARQLPPEGISMMDTELRTLSELLGNAGGGGAGRGRSFADHLRNLTPQQALLGVGGVALASRAGDIAASAVGGKGGDRRGGPVIIN